MELKINRNAERAVVKTVCYLVLGVVAGMAIYYMFGI